MTHPTPTTATRASPPPRGEGLGVGGRPVTANPAPAPEPGPRSTRRATLLGQEVPGQARDGVFFPLIATLTLLTAPAAAQVIPTGTPAADILLSRAIAEHRVFLTCSALDPLTHAQILTNWQRDTAAAVVILQAHKVPPEAIAAFTQAADPAALMSAEDTPWGQVKGLCDTHPDWQKTYYEFNLTILDLKLPGAFQ